MLKKKHILSMPRRQEGALRKARPLLWLKILDLLVTLRWFGTVLGRTKCANFFVKTNCLWHKQLGNELILGGHRAPFFRKWVRTLLFSTFLSMEWNGKTVTCLPLGSNFDNF